MKTEKEHKLRMAPGTYYIWCGGSCDYGHEERSSGGAYIMQKDDVDIDTYVISDDHTTEFRMILSVMIHAMEVIPVFSKSACVSPAVGFAMRDFRKEAKLSNLNPDTRIFFSWGTHEWKKSDLPMTRNIMELEGLVQEKGASTWLYHQQGGRHCEADWEIQIPTWMQFLWG